MVDDLEVIGLLQGQAETERTSVRNSPGSKLIKNINITTKFVSLLNLYKIWASISAKLLPPHIPWSVAALLSKYYPSMANLKDLLPSFSGVPI